MTASFVPAPAPQGLLILAYYYAPSVESGALRPGRFAKYLPRCGWHAEAVTADAPQLGSPGWVRALAALQRVLPYNDLLPWVPHAIAAAESRLAQAPAAAVLSTSPPVACHIAALVLKRRYGLRWVADFRDPMLGNPGRSRRFGWVYDGTLERLIVSHADAVIANTDTAAARLRSRYPRWADKIHLIWNGYDPDTALQPQPIPARDYKLLVHAGSIYAGRYPTALLASMDRLIAAGRIDPRRARIRLIGWMDLADPWARQPAFERLRENGCLELVERQVPRDEAVRQMAEADCLLLLDLTRGGVGLQLPAKLFEYARFGRPILTFTAPGSPCERILARSGLTHVCINEHAAPSRIDEEICRFWQMDSTPVQPSRWFQQQFDGAAQTATLAAILEGAS